MEIRINGKLDESGPGMKTFSAWITNPQGREVLVINIGECKITVHPFSRNQIRSLGQKLVELSGSNDF